MFSNPKLLEAFQALWYLSQRKVTLSPLNLLGFSRRLQLVCSTVRGTYVPPNLGLNHPPAVTCRTAPEDERFGVEEEFVRRSSPKIHRLEEQNARVEVVV
ncbi:hypothetical protein ONS95_008879 [Cadophora gregata]|uniref:uncharacterized protein n=1 Tax=Cadophora gregata TaxID=51156 RepID=UPI0026DD8BE3|nr:uncharacterized protein ONS95_008879 [Cadophora gregata]KAK0123886.1 hypothetical protein ONS95_008879 [Cadophora gregata]